MEARAPVDVAPGSVAPGAQCNGNPDCSEGTCVDGVCCLDPSCPLCQVCGSGGRCVKVGGGVVDPHFRCHPPDSPTSCGRSGACDGLGGCAFYPAGVTCKAGTCDGDAVVGSSVCDGFGACIPGATIVCVPFKCASGDCRNVCTSDVDCVSGRHCESGSCGRRMKGARCGQNDDCVSGFCSDGVCCNSPCDGPCMSCNLPLREGSCFPVLDGSPDPHFQCHDEGPASCGSTGVCDGLGGCAKYGFYTVCLRTCTSDGLYLTTTHCNGLGRCGSSMEVTECPMYVCSASASICQ
jgi:hypothetical protein